MISMENIISQTTASESSIELILLNHDFLRSTVQKKQNVMTNIY